MISYWLARSSGIVRFVLDPLTCVVLVLEALAVKISVVVLIGVILLVGIVVNNAIVLVDAVNQRRRGGMDRDAALQAAGRLRLRPILMTTTTTVLGLLPLVLFSASADANIWNALAFALIGGLLSSTVFVLTTTPALYLLFERRAAEATEPSPAHGPLLPRVRQPV